MCVHFLLFHPIKYNSAYFKILLGQYFPYLGRNSEKKKTVKHSGSQGEGKTISLQSRFKTEDICYVLS